MTTYENTLNTLRATPRRWLVTGCAGFIGSHILEALLRLGQSVTGLDNFATGFAKNLDLVRAAVGDEAWARFRFIDGTVADAEACREAVVGVDAISHQAGFISVPQSLEDPLACHATNVTGTLNLLIAARDAGAKRVAYASSCAVYGDETTMPMREDRIGRALSPYGASKLMDESYAGLFAMHFGMRCVGLRYFNVFGPRQNPKGGYAAVIPAWIVAQVQGEECLVNGDGGQTRDFCHVANIVQANILAATTENDACAGHAYNVGLGGSTDLNALHRMISEKLVSLDAKFVPRPPRYGPARNGDLRHASADISKAARDLGFAPAVSVDAGLTETVAWYAAK
jgi:UDP-N-acetylglucosamine/UDP-N-acetylgalactosamine 4-epimerase